jgi:hypothetical protein
MMLPPRVLANGGPFMNRMLRVLPRSFLVVALITTAVYAIASPTEPSFPNINTWINHFREDILPYWTMDEALGSPVGNFPTFRDMSGTPTASTDRYVRNLARQVYVYLIGYSLTGDTVLLEHAKKGLAWIDNHAVDQGKGFFTILDVKGTPISNVKSAQDIAYIMLAYSADFFVTRSPASQRKLEEIVRLIFEGPFWNRENGAVIDALDNSLTEEVPFENDGVDIVTILDQVNAYLLLFTNQLSGVARRDLLYRLRHLGDLLVTRFYTGGIFWNTDINRTNYDAKHVDTGHTAKTYWMLRRISTLWEEEFKYTLYEEVLKNAKHLLIQAYGVDPASFWGMRFSPILGVIKTNPDWWIQIELDQLSADLSLLDKTFVELLENKSSVWLRSNFIDRSRPARGIREGIKWDNTLYGDDNRWESKANKWKNGYHETEHCFVLHIVSHAILTRPLTLYFALSDGAEVTAIRPYILKNDIHIA